MADESKPKRPGTSRSDAAKPDKDKAKVEDAVVIDETGADDAASQDAATEDVTETEGVDAPDAPEERPEADLVEKDQAPASAMPAAPRRRGGAMTLLFGAVAAAAIGAGGLYYAQMRGWLTLGDNTGELAAQIETQRGAIEALRGALTAAESEIAELRQSQPDGDAIDAALAGLRKATDAASGELAALDGTVAGLRARIEQVETQPIPKAKLPDEIVNAYDRQMAEVLAAVDGRFAEMQRALDGKLAEIAAAQAAAEQSEAAAQAAAKAADARAALARIASALDGGEGFADDLAVFGDASGLVPPGALTGVAEEGAPTLGNLTAAFPAAARAALTASTKAAAEQGEVSPLQAFLRTQLGARSLAPREGDDADAVLSRAEAAVAAGDLSAAMTEIVALPEAGQAELADWVALAETRRAALAAAADLAAQLDN